MKMIKTGPLFYKRGLNRSESSEYIGVSTSKFDEMVNLRKMPHPKRVDSRKIWDRFEIDNYFSELPSDLGDIEPNPWDE